MQLDDSPAHNAQLTKDCIFESDVAFLDWATKSTNISIIENKWRGIARQVYKDFRQFDYEGDLCEAIFDTWGILPMAYVKITRDIPPSLTTVTYKIFSRFTECAIRS